VTELSTFQVTGTLEPSSSVGAINGVVSFTMLVQNNGVLAAPTLDVPATVVPIVTHSAIDNNVLNPVPLLANTAALNLTGALVYRADFSNMYYTMPDEQPVELTLESITFAASPDTTPIDLTFVTPVAGSAATQPLLPSTLAAYIMDATTFSRQFLTTAIDAPTARSQLGAAADAAAEKIANKNQPSGYAGLDGGGRIPSALWPAGIDEIIEYATLSGFPTTGASGVIYLAQDTGRQYRWSGTLYAVVSPSPGSTDAVPEGSTNLYYTNARADARVEAANLVPWSGGTAGKLPATSGQELITQGGNTLDDGSGNVVIKGGSLQGVTIGATTAAPSINATTLVVNHNVTLSGTQKPWLNATATVAGNLTSSSGAANSIGFNDQVNFTGSNFFTGLNLVQNIVSPAVGARQGISGYVHVLSTAAGQTQVQAQYIGVAGSAQIDVNLGGTDTTTSAGPRGNVWGLWGYARSLAAATNLSGVFGAELDVSVPSGSSTQLKNILRLAILGGDAVRGTVEDAGIVLAKGSGGSATLVKGILFGSEQGSLAATPSTQGNWPFDSTSTMIGTSAPYGSDVLAANIGIDFSKCTFSDSALKAGASPIAMLKMASAPTTTATNEGRVYIHPDGSLHFLSPGGTDTQLAPA
jgi:hypothetical protein